MSQKPSNKLPKTALTTNDSFDTNCITDTNANTNHSSDTNTTINTTTDTTTDTMGTLASELYDASYDKTERESPFDDAGTLWKNSHEIVCDATGIVIRGSDDFQNADTDTADTDEAPRYTNSGKVILAGGMQSVYHWGNDDGTFVYDK